MSFPPVITEYGDDCLTCFPPDLTPLYRYVTFGGIERGDLWIPGDGMPPNGIFILVQKVAVPCLWRNQLGPARSVYYDCGPVNTLLRYVYSLPRVAFTSLVAATCIKFHVNQLNTPVGNHFYGGLAYVFTPQEMQDYIESVTPIVDPDPQMNVYPIAGEKIVVQYTDSWGDTNVKMLVDLNP